MQFVSSGLLQLVALPVFAVASRRGNAEVMVLIRETHDVVMEMHEQHAADLAALHAKVGEQ